MLWTRRHRLHPFLPSRAAERGSLLALAGGSAEIIDESYNANPASMRAALALLVRQSLSAAVGALPCWEICWSWAPKALRCTQRSPAPSKMPR